MEVDILLLLPEVDHLDVIDDETVKWVLQEFRRLMGDRKFGIDALLMRRGSAKTGQDLTHELRQQSKRVSRLLREYNPKVLMVVGPELLRLLKPSIAMRPNKNVIGYVHRMEFGKKLPTVCLPHLFDKHQVLLHSDELVVTFAKATYLLDHPNASKDGKIIKLDDDKEASDYIDFLLNDHKGYVAYDTETPNRNKRYFTHLASMQFATDEDTSYVLYWKHKYNLRNKDKDETVLRPKLRKLFSGHSKIKGFLAHYATFDIGSTRTEFKIDYWGSKTYDTLLLAHHMDQNRDRSDRITQPLPNHSAYELKQLVNEFYGYDGYEEEAMAARKDGSLLDLPEPRLTRYAGQDGFCEYRLFDFILHWAKSLGREKDILQFATYIHSGALRTFQDMSYEGMLVDLEHVEALAKPDSIINVEIARAKDKFKDDPLTQRVNEALLKKKTNATHFWQIPFVFDISKAMSKYMLFYDKEVGLGLEMLPDPKKPNEKLKPKFDDHFQKVYSKVPQVQWYTAYQDVEKLRNTYIVKPAFKIRNAKRLKTDLVDGCIHCNFNLNGTDTGRLSSSEPNLQNIPRADNDFKKAVKNVYITPPGTCIVQPDFSAAEVRMWGSLSSDAFLCELLSQAFAKRAAYRANPKDHKIEEEASLMGDIHKQTASLMFGVPIKEVKKDLRTITKSITFGLIYGRGERSIADQLKKNEEETHELCLKFFAQFPDGVAWLESMKQFVREHHYVETPFKRRRYLPWINDTNSKWRSSAERQSINTPVQSAAGDYAVLSISLLHEEIHKRRLSKHYKLINMVHDSTLIQCPESANALAEITAITRECFTVRSKEITENVFNFEMKAPMDIDVEVSQRKAHRCTKCGNVYKYYKNKCDAPIIGADKKPVKDKEGNEIKCSHTGYTDVALNGGWGTLIPMDETMRGYREAAMGFGKNS